MDYILHQIEKAEEDIEIFQRKIEKEKRQKLQKYESTISFVLLLPIFVATIFVSKKDLFAVIVSSVFKLTYPSPTTDVR